MDSNNISNIVHNGLITAQDTIKQHTTDLNLIIPKDIFHEVVDKLKEFYIASSIEMGDLIGEIITHLTDARDDYLKAIQLSNEWSAFTEKLLTTYLRSFKNDNEDNRRTRQRLLLKVFTNGIEQLSAAQPPLRTCVQSLGHTINNMIHFQNLLTSQLHPGYHYFDTKCSEITKQAAPSATATVICGSVLTACVGRLFFAVRGTIITTIAGLFGFCSLTSFFVRRTARSRTVTECERLNQKFGQLRRTVEVVRTSIKATIANLQDMEAIITKTRDQLKGVQFEASQTQQEIEERKVDVSNLIAICNDQNRKHSSMF